MTSTTFLPNQTSIQADWLNDVNTKTYADTSNTVAYTPAGTGAVATTVQTKLRESVSVKDFGAVGDGVTDDTAAFVAAFDASDEVYAPAPSVSYRISSITLGDNKALRTDGYATLIHQTSGTAVGTRVICVAGSNVTVGSLSIRGNIATDTNEQNHGVFVRGSGVSIQNITIGDIKGEDIRGDVLYLGASSGFTTRYVTFGRVVGKNILRNVVSIAGASYVAGEAAITDTSTGLWALDIEPDVVTSHNIYVGYVKGAAMGVVPTLLANSAYNIEIGMADLDPAFGVDSTPAYSGRSVGSAVSLRNILGLRIGQLRCNGHSLFAINYIWNGGEQRGEAISIGYLKLANIGASEATYNTLIQASAINSITIDDGNITHYSAGKSVITGDSSGSTFTRVILNRIKCDGKIARWVYHGRFSNILINSVYADSAFQQCYDCTIMDSDITIPTLAAFVSNLVFVNVKAVCSTAYYGSTCIGMTRINCSFAGVLTPYTTTMAATAGQAGETVIGGTTSATIGAAGGAAALPATPLGYIVSYVGTTAVKIPYYTA